MKMHDEILHPRGRMLENRLLAALTLKIEEDLIQIEAMCIEHLDQAASEGASDSGEIKGLRDEIMRPLERLHALNSILATAVR